MTDFSNSILKGTRFLLSYNPPITRQKLFSFLKRDKDNYDNIQATGKRANIGGNKGMITPFRLTCGGQETYLELLIKLII